MVLAVDEDDLLVLEDLVGDAVVASPGGSEPFELTEQRFGETLWIVGDRPEDRFEPGGVHLRRQTMEVPET